MSTMNKCYQIQFLFILIVLLSSFIFFTPRTFANDTAATVSTEEIVFKPNKEISLEEEVLKISPEEIEVNYIFFNHSDKEIVTDVAFPLPPAPVKGVDIEVFPSWDEAYHAQRFLSNNPGSKDTKNLDYSGSHNTLKNAMQNAPFLNFSRKINGVESGYQYRIVAKTHNGKDITALLHKNEIPISATYLAGYQENSPLDKNLPMKKKLKDLQLLDENDKPNWQNQTIYYWQQSFKPKERLVVSHRYRPSFGYNSIHANHPNNLKDIQVNSQMIKLENYCIDENTQQKILELFKNSNHLPIREIQYILTTANNWRSPIKKFRIEIKSPENSLVSLCWPGKLTKTTDNILVSEIQDFIPKEEIKILFIGPPYNN